MVRLRADVDERSRYGFYKLSKIQASLKMEADKANAIYNDFVAHKSRIDHKSNVLRLSKKYNCTIEDVADLALATYMIPDLSDPEKKRQLPPSKHKPMAGLMLQGCAHNADPLAIVHILSAIYLNMATSHATAHEIALLFPESEIAKYHSTLEDLCSKSEKIALGPDCLTLKGLFLEKRGQTEKAKEAFQLAIKRSHLQPGVGAKNPLLLPLIAPWNALGYLLASNKDPTVQAQAKTYFLLGAKEADDPLSCYEVAKYETRTSPDWLKWTSKAAASGHAQASFDLAEFYQELSKDPQPILKSSGMRKALNWLLKWRPDDAGMLAREWLQVASNLGHKPAALQLADYCESVGDYQGATEHFRRILEQPHSAAQVEAWPQIVRQAQRRLDTLRTKMPA